MAVLDFLGKFFAVVGGVWMLALAYKVVGDTWDALFSKKYKKWLAQFTQTGKSHLNKTGKKLTKIIKSQQKERRESIIFPIIKPKPKPKPIPKRKTNDKKVKRPSRKNS